MEVKKLSDGRLVITFSAQERDQLSAAAIEHAEDMATPVLDLSSLLRKARYLSRNEFRQPPHAWEPGVRHP